MPSNITPMGAGSRRPTLPSIHTLALPMPDVQYAQPSNARPGHLRHAHHDRNVSTSSSMTSVSRSPSPGSPQEDSSSSTPKFRLVPCEMENAEAVILVSPPGANDSDSSKSKSILLVGPAWHAVCRNPKRPLAKGSRVHPYRIIRGDNKSRRASVSVTAFPVFSLPRSP